LYKVKIYKQGIERKMKAWNGMERHGNARNGKVSEDKAWQAKPSQGK
jgi:hypothetical protein